MADTAVLSPVGGKKDKTSRHSKHDRDDKKHKKRHRDSEVADTGERKHKKSKSIIAVSESEQPESPLPNSKHGHHEKEKKSKKHKKRHSTADVEITQVLGSPEPPATIRIDEEEDGSAQKPIPETKSMDLSSSGSQVHIGRLPDKRYPFYTQTISQYLPLYPSGMVEPIQGYAEQHLRPLLNRYVRTFGGVLLAYRNPRLGAAPGQGALTEKSGPDDSTVLESINEYAVAFGWFTVEVDLFRPTRGAWLEGSVKIQSEGHIGVVCWSKFQASIEAGRLPRDWHWVDLLSSSSNRSSKKGKGDDRNTDAAETTLPTPEPAEPEENENTTQIHETGYWVDGDGTRIGEGTNLCFRIKNYEVGDSDDYGYLILEGTMLNEEDEKNKVLEEMETARRQKLKHGGLLRKTHKRLPEFGMTKFGREEAQEGENDRAEVWKSSRVSSETE
ncbi:hypothetical protein F5X96DRAFT_558360 [Biscogniauxia mediterranea]|nr:hypothetical protein F5X96DRAFT_558360 [Biscogniauxia mediterranea]